ncbi:MAG: Coenzyme F420 hydrogenase/dehydrogenase, beta subunit C-terminal domain [Natronomonas sp.]
MSKSNDTYETRSPSVGNDPRDDSDVNEPAGKTWFRDLDEAVIESGRCVQCGSCVAACPSNSLGIDELEGRPTLVKMCTGCSRCWDYCPRAGLRYERVLETIEASRPEPETYAARATESVVHDAGENGGAVTALLASLLSAGAIDGAVVASDNDAFGGEAALVTSPTELIETAGSVYSQTMQLGRLRELLKDSGLEDPDLALVGTPCVIEGAAALLEFGREDDLASVDLTVSLMCTSSFEADRLRSLIADHGVDPTAVEGLQVIGSAVTVYDEDGRELLSVDLEDLSTAVLRGCDECADFTGRAADISAGTIGSPNDATTLITRSERGKRALETAAEALEIEPLSESGTDALEAWNRRRAEETIPRDLDPEGSLSISYETHRAAYDGTDREPEPLNRARVYQYEEWC